MCDESSKKNLSRRNFLYGAITLGAGTFLLDPIRALSEGIADNLIMRAHAEATGMTSSRNYINIQLAGAPLRYQFDQWLKINTSESLSVAENTQRINGMVCNSYVIDSSGKVTPEYNTFTYKNILTPLLFSQQVYNSQGQKRPLTDLLNNMLVIRGFGSGLDGHQFNALLQQIPIGGVNTISGITAENTQTTFDAVQWPDRGDRSAFSSQKGKAQSKLGGTKPLNSLMEGFTPPTNLGVKNLKDKMKVAMDLAQDRLKTYARSENTGSKIVAQNLTNAQEMMQKGSANLDTYWTEAVARYKAAIDKSMRETNLPKISDKPLIPDESSQFNIGTGDLIVPSKSRDLREAIKNVTMQNLAESLAMAEYLLKENLASAIDLKADGWLDLDITSVKVNADGTKGTATNNKQILGLDMHATGAASAILLTTSYYRGLTAGILELIDQLGPQIWSNTVIQVQGDFGRSARSSESGSDHGFKQMVTSVFSGAFNNGPIVVGNILKGGANAQYSGTQGLAAPIAGYNQTGAPTPAMAAATVVAILGVDKNPFQNTAGPLVSLSGTTLQTIFPAKIIE